MTTLRRLADSSRPPSHALIPQLRSVVSIFLTRQYSTENGCGGIDLLNGSSGCSSASKTGFVNPLSRRCFDSRAVGIRMNAIPLYAWTVLRRLQEEGELHAFHYVRLRWVHLQLRFQALVQTILMRILFFNPMDHIIYDYVNGVRDVRQNKMRTMIPANDYFKEDPARILRGFRIAARLGFQFSSKSSRAIWDLSSSITTIPKARLMLEMNSMLSYGAAESTIRLLTKYGLLDILLPFQAAYISDQMKVRSSDRDLMLMKLLANMDKLLSVNRPGHRILWLALLAFHSALINSPQDAQVIRAFAGLLKLRTWDYPMNFMEQGVGARASFVPETIGSSLTKLDNLMEQTSHMSQINSSVETLTCVR
ncbi:hypothetical protein QOZ80_3AG0232510 [Eleusine coracana subsp. coracana]|nr:hypothetical protein QOZ80_3AG0232510 [Eleusine coracana subsp. coracana]